MIAYRQRLVKSKRGRPAVALEVAAKELACFTDKQFSALIVKDSHKHVKQLQESILSLDKQLEQIIKEDEEVHRVYKLATAGRPRSVTGIGLQTAALMLLHTNCFTSFDDWRQFACYSGTAPFEHSSGSSIRGKTRLSKVGNMKMKAWVAPPYSATEPVLPFNLIMSSLFTTTCLLTGAMPGNHRSWPTGRWSGFEEAIT